MNIREMICWGLTLLAPVAGVCSEAADARDFDRHGYLFVSAGEADTHRRLSVADVVEGDDDSFEIGAGYAFNPYLSIEGSYQSFGKPDGFVGCPIDVFCIAVVPFAREDVEVDGWTGALRGSLPVTGRLSVFARVGLLAWETSARSAPLDDSGTDLLYGLGLAADVTDRFAVQLSYEETGVDVDTVKLGLRMRL